MIMADGDSLDLTAMVHHLNPRGRMGENPVPQSLAELKSVKQTILEQQFEPIQKTFLLQALKTADGNISRGRQEHRDAEVQLLGAAEKVQHLRFGGGEPERTESGPIPGRDFLTCPCSALPFFPEKPSIPRHGLRNRRSAKTGRRPCRPRSGPGPRCTC